MLPHRLGQVPGQDGAEAQAADAEADQDFPRNVENAALPRRSAPMIDRTIVLAVRRRPPIGLRQRGVVMGCGLPAAR